MELTALTDAVMRRLFVELEASGRHIHVTQAQAMTLFGHRLTPKRPLSQPGQFLANERVSLIGPKGEMHNVAVLGPERPEAQVEISLTDGRTLGITPPVRPSGQVADTPGICLKGERGTVKLAQGVIAAQRQMHVHPADAEVLGVTDKQIVKVRLDTARPLIFDDVVCRVSPKFALAMHIDTDECNAACAFGTVYGEVIA